MKTYRWEIQESHHTKYSRPKAQTKVIWNDYIKQYFVENRPNNVKENEQRTQKKRKTGDSDLLSLCICSDVVSESAYAL